MVTGDGGCEAYTAIAWGVGLSLERSDIAGAEGFHWLEGNMCGTAMRGADALPGSKATSRAKGSYRNLGDLGSDRNGVAVAGPHREGEEPKPMMNGPEKSDPVIVAMKPANKAEGPPAARPAEEKHAAELVERRAGTKGNADQQSTRRTQRRESVSQALERIRQAASDRPAVIHLRWEPVCGKAARTDLCGGRAMKRTSLPLQRREFIAGLAGSGAWALAARAQQGKIPVIGFIGSSPERPRFVAGFLKGLGEIGYVEGRDVAIEYRWVEGQNDRLPAFVSDLISRRVSVIAELEGTPGVLIAKAATRTIPIVFRMGADPVASGIVSSLNRPEANITGITNLGDELEAKRLEFLRELLPPDATVALLVNPTNANAADTVDDVQAAARVLGLRLLILRARTQADTEAAFASISQQDIRGLVVTTASLFFQYREQLITMVAGRAIPAIYPDRLFSEAGGLMSYGTDIPDGYRLAGTYVGRVLKGEKPSDLPVQQSTKVELVLNMKTSKALGVTFPLPLLGRADEVIE